MSRLAPFAHNLRHSRSKSSLAASDTTYHSFQDIEMYSPTSPPTTPSTPFFDVPFSAARPLKNEDPLEAPEMKRQDSGYESCTPRPSPPSHSARRRTSTSTTSSCTRRTRARPSMRRSAKSGPVSHLPRANNGQSALYLTRTPPPPPPAPASTYFHFPRPQSELIDPYGRMNDFSEPVGEDVAEPPYPPPPQTTHYWTSDRTRRLEYAAIDAASRGVRGWVMKHMVPECFVPREQRRVRFDDDRGSVRRYRLDLDEEPEEKGGKKGWFWRRSTQ